MRVMPTSRRHWVAYYAKLFCRTGRETAAHLACWYQLLELADGAPE